MKHSSLHTQNRRLKEDLDIDKINDKLIFISDEVYAHLRKIASAKQKSREKTKVYLIHFFNLLRYLIEKNIEFVI